MRKRFSLFTVVALVILSVLAGTRLGTLFSGDSVTEQATKYSDVLSLTMKYYVDDVDTQRLTESAISGLLAQLDPHSVYIAPSALPRVQEDFQGSFEGIGIEYQVLNDTLLVVAPIVGGPSEALGIQSGDKIVRIDDSSSVGITQEGVQRKLRGPKGTKVRVTIVRTGFKEPLEFEITRDRIPIYTVDASFMVDEQIGYINVNRFAAKTHDEFAEALSKLRGSGMKRLVLDLRTNAGGYLEQAFKMADEFFPRGKKIVYTKGRRPEAEDEYVSTGGGHYQDIPLVILVNNGSASASEIVTGAIQDWDRGLIVGETTFGKGLVQRQFELRDGSALRLTTARYYTPSGRLIQRPYENGRAQYASEPFERVETEGENINHEAEKDSTRPKFKTMGGRIVYGGGGITPDYIVRADRLTQFSVQLRSRLVFLQYADHYLETHGPELREKYEKDIPRFVQEFAVTPEMLEQVLEVAKTRGVEFNKGQYEKDRPYIEAFTKAFIARGMWGNEGSSRVMLKEDSQFQKAVALFPEAERISHSITSLK